MEGWTEGRTDPNFTGPFRLPPGPKKIWHYWKATVACNIKVENILEKRKIKVEKNEEKFSTFWLKQLQPITKISILSDHENTNFF